MTSRHVDNAGMRAPTLPELMTGEAAHTDTTVDTSPRLQETSR